MFAWFASLFVLLLHGNSARVAPLTLGHSTGSTTVHAMDDNCSTTTTCAVRGSTHP